jgi:CHC2-type zinc finger protein
MSVQMILARLNGVRHNDNGWMARCPAHEDRNPSLSIREKNGKTLLHCFGGCSIEAVCTAMGIRMSDLFNEPGARHKPEPRIVREAQKRITGLHSRLTRGDRERAVIVVLADDTGLDAAIARALALAVEGELVQVALDGEGQ